MSQYPEEWFRRGEPAPSTDPTRVLPTVERLSAERTSPGQLPVEPPPARRTRRWPRRLVGILALVLLLGVATAGGLVLYANSRITHTEALGDYEGRPAATPGTDWLILGSDSRAGTADEGEVGAQRADTIILLHIPQGGGGPTLVSIPRDSLVEVPAFGKSKASRQKINAAYAIGGPTLMARTVERATGIRLDHVAELGFGGFVGIVDAVGGVTLCVNKPLVDRDSGANFPAGCTEAGGDQSLAFVRARKTDPLGDLGRIQRQQQFLGALTDGVLNPATLLNPVRLWGVTNAGIDAVVVDEDTGTLDLARLALTMRGLSQDKGTTTTVPVADPDFNVRGLGSTVKWDTGRAKKLFDLLRQDQPVPKPELPPTSR